MNFRDYQTLAMRTAKDLPTDRDNLLHAALGLSSEVGEFISEVKRHTIYGVALTDETLAHMQEEVGDILWYTALAASSLHCGLAALAQQNLDKLATRYPDRYSDYLAEARLDKDGLPHTQS